MVSERTVTEWLGLLMPVGLLGICMAYLRLRTQGYFNRTPQIADRKLRFSMVDVVVFCTAAAAVAAFVRNVIIFPLLR